MIKEEEHDEEEKNENNNLNMNIQGHVKVSSNVTENNSYYLNIKQVIMSM